MRHAAWITYASEAAISAMWPCQCVPQSHHSGRPCPAESCCSLLKADDCGENAARWCSRLVADRAGQSCATLCRNGWKLLRVFCGESGRCRLGPLDQYDCMTANAVPQVGDCILFMCSNMHACKHIFVLDCGRGDLQHASACCLWCKCCSY